MISIIIPAYNAEKYILETINSVINQTFKDWELIIIDDGSTDKTANIVKEFCENDKRINYYYQKNSGVSVARNFGMSKAKGEYIAFLDADDIWLPEFLKYTVNFLNNNNDTGLVNTNVQFIDSNNKKLDIYYTGVTDKDIGDLIFFRLTNKTTGPSGTLIRTNIAKEIGGFNNILSNVADKMFYIDISKITKLKNIDKVLWQYRFHTTSMHMNIKNMTTDYENFIIEIKEKSYIKDIREFNFFKHKIYKICLKEALKQKKIKYIIKYLIKTIL